MYTLRSEVLFLHLLMAGLGDGVPLIIHPGSFGDMQVNSLDTLNSSIPGFYTSLNGSTGSHGGENTSAGGVLPLNIVNKFSGSNVLVYLSGLDMNQQLVMLDKDGSYYYPATNSSTPTPLGSNVAIPLGSPNNTLSLKLPGFINSARVWIADGGLELLVIATPNGPGLVEPSVTNAKDPNSGTNYAFAEFDWTPNGGLYADISLVDFVGLPLGISVLESTGSRVSALGVPANAADVVCDNLKAQARRDGHPWDQLCVYNATGGLVRVMSPTSYMSVNSSAFEGYFSKYGQYCWDRYTRTPLTIDTQSGAGKVDCSVSSNNTLVCDGDNRDYPLPSAEDVFGCNTGTFAIESTDNQVHRAVVPRLCAAFNRATLFLPHGNVQPGVAPSHYYTVHPMNWYSALIHSIEVDGKGYAFAYDDISPSEGDDVSGLIISPSPTSLDIIVGGA